MIVNGNGARRSLRLAVCAVVAGCVSLCLAADPAARPKAQKLAIVNVSYIFERYQKVADLQLHTDSFKKDEKERLNAEARNLGRRYAELEPRLNMVNRDERVLLDAQTLSRDKFKYEQAMNALNVEIQNKYTKEMREILSDIRGAIRVIAERGGFDFVLRSPNTDEVSASDPKNPAMADQKQLAEMLEPKSTAELVERFNRNPVLYGAQTVDISADVLKKINEDYAKRMGAGGR